MEKDLDQLILIQTKLLVNEPLLPAEEELWQQWLDLTATIEQPDWSLSDIVFLLDTCDQQLPADQFLEKLEKDAAEYSMEEDLHVKEALAASASEEAVFIENGPVFNLKKWLNIAAVSLIMLLLATFLLVFKGNLKSANSSLITASTRIGEVKKITLSDNSVIRLNAASSITYPETVNPQARIIQLTGEAYFNIAKQPLNEPLRIRSGILDIEVIGTQFNIAAYEEDSTFKVTLEEGEIYISNGKEKKRLIAPVIAHVCRDSIPVTSPKHPGKEIGWIDNIFSYAELSLPEIMANLKRWYGVSANYEKFNVTSDTTKYSVPYSRNDSLTTILDRLELINHFEYRPKGRQFKIGDTITFIRKP